MDISLKRIIAYVIDVAIIIAVVMVLSSIPFINKYNIKYADAYDKYNEIMTKVSKNEVKEEDVKDELINLNYDLSKYNVVNNCLTVAGILVYFGVIQSLWHGQTVGKKLMNIKLIRLQNKKLNIGITLLRTTILCNVLFRILLIASIYFLTPYSFLNFASIISTIERMITLIILVMVVLRSDGRSLHDLIAKTQVIDLKVEAAKEQPEKVTITTKAKKEVEKKIKEN